jgi:hypothetical protein
VAEALALQLYDEFEAKRREAERLEAEHEDLAALEQLEQMARMEK